MLYISYSTRIFVPEMSYFFKKNKNGCKVTTFFRFVQQNVSKIFQKLHFVKYSLQFSVTLVSY